MNEAAREEDDRERTFRQGAKSAADEETEIVSIDRVEMGTGWVCFQAGENPPPDNELPHFLHDAFYHWLQRNPEFKVRSVLPIVEKGNTVAIHIWFE